MSDTLGYRAGLRNVSEPDLTANGAGIGLIVGCARSGTSILGELVASHPRVRYVFEPHTIWELGGHGPDDSHRLTGDDATPAVRTAIRRWFEEQRNGAPLVIDKTPRNALRIPFVRSVFPEARIVHIIRDGRDVACSLMPGIGGNEWEHLKPPNWRTLMAQSEGIERCALAWQAVMEIVVADLRSVPHLTVRYEELVKSPVATANQVLEFLGLPVDPAVLSFTGNIQDEFENSYHAREQDRWYRDIHQKRVGRWKDLTPEGRALLNETLEPMLARFGYLTDGR